VFYALKSDGDIGESLCWSRKAWPALLLVGLFGCSDALDTQMRTLASGRQIEVFRVFSQEGPRGTILNYFYFTRHLSDRPALEPEWAEVLSDAQREAQQAKARELILIASEKHHWLVTLLTHDRSHSGFYQRDGDTWRKVREN
jgi:hypothetical protein